MKTKDATKDAKALKFKDTAGREYEAVVTLRTAAALHKIGVDLNNLTNGSLLTQLSSDVQLMGDALWLTVEKSAAAQNVTPEDFAESLGGDTLQAAVDAMLAAMTSFLPLGSRSAFGRVLETSRQVEKLALERANQALDAITPESVLASMRRATVAQQIDRQSETQTDQQSESVGAA